MALVFKNGTMFEAGDDITIGTADATCTASVKQAGAGTFDPGEDFYCLVAPYKGLGVSDETETDVRSGYLLAECSTKGLPAMVPPVRVTVTVASEGERVFDRDRVGGSAEMVITAIVGCPPDSGQTLVYLHSDDGA